MVGAFVAALTAALAANRVKALALPVENVAVPRRSLADGAPCVSLITALLELRSSSRAAPARTCTLPCMSVLRRSPPNRVVPISAAASPTCARSAAITVPRLLAAGAPKAGIVTRLAASTAAKIVRRICIGASRLLHRRILRPANAVNQETPPSPNSLRGRVVSPFSADKYRHFLFGLYTSRVIAALRRSTWTSQDGSVDCAYLRSFSGERSINSIRSLHLAQSRSRRAILPPLRFTTSSLPSCARSCPSTCAQVLTTFRSPILPLT